MAGEQRQTNLPKQTNLQDAFLNRLRREKTPVTIIVMNGFQLNHLLITGYDNFVILADNGEKQIMIYKHAISTIAPEIRQRGGEEEKNEPNQ